MQLFCLQHGICVGGTKEIEKGFPAALKLFAKETGVPVALIIGPSGEQTSGKVRKFCQEIGMALRILEEHTQWANLAELYIGLSKEAI